MTTLTIEPVSPALGAVVNGVDLAQPLDAPDLRALREALANRGVLFFHGQALTPEQHLAFARQFAPVNVNRFFAAVPGHPEIAEVRKEPDQTTNIGGGWHTDHSYDSEPALGSILYAHVVPATGGDTLFASMYKAYEGLSEGLKKTLTGLHAVHSSRHVFGAARAYAGTDIGERIGNPEAATQDAVHPVVITHPESGKRALYVNPGFTVRFDGWTVAESRPLLEYLYQHATKPEYTYRFAWQSGAIAFWDNRATWHYALNDYHGQRRLLHRITLEGSAL